MDWEYVGHIESMENFSSWPPIASPTGRVVVYDRQRSIRQMKRNTEQTVLTLLAAIDPVFRLPFPVPVQKRNSLSDDRNWETLPQPCTKIRIAGEIRPTPSPAHKISVSRMTV